MNPNIIKLCCTALALYKWAALAYPRGYLYLPMSLFLW